jgi:hypothetical protein
MAARELADTIEEGIRLNECPIEVYAKRGELACRRADGRCQGQQVLELGLGGAKIFFS